MLGAIVGAVAIGVVLGLMGSGGSTLTVPILVYGLGHADKQAFAESMAIVAGIALAGVVPHAFAGHVDWRNVLWFGLPGIAGTYGGSWLSRFMPGPLQLVLLAGVMATSAIMMFREQPPRPRGDEVAGETAFAARRAFWKIMIEGLLVGILTGLVAVGGGFLILPALVLVGGVPMRMAVGTSLCIIGLKSATGFHQHWLAARNLGQAVNWTTVVLFVLCGAAGSVIGQRIGQRISQRRLKRAFAVFIAAMSALIVVREFPRLISANPPQRSGSTPEVQPAPAGTALH